ncbi:MAG: hypothetical protein FWF10_05695 [Clostridiales bacterium]|nr:hypothetical protein [Clostridiales bacterium]
MGDSLSSQNWPSNERIIRKMQEHINENLGENIWDELTANNVPTSSMSDAELSRSTELLISRFDRIADNNMANKVFSQVRHGLERADFIWAREKFLHYGDIDTFAQALRDEQMKELHDHLHNQTEFYGQPITTEVYDFVNSIDDLFYGKRYGDKILATAIPFRTLDYLHAKDTKKKQYYMCHCQFARESILSDLPVSKTMCYCSLGHNLMFWETVLDAALKGDVVSSALDGNFHCKFVIYLPDDVTRKYVHTK